MSRSLPSTNCGRPTKPSLGLQFGAPSAPTRKPALGFWTEGKRTVRTERWRLIVHPSKNPAEAPGYELFDFSTDPNEARNVAAEQPDVVARLTGLLPAAPLTPSQAQPARRRE